MVMDSNPSQHSSRKVTKTYFLWMLSFSFWYVPEEYEKVIDNTRCCVTDLYL